MKCSKCNGEMEKGLVKPKRGTPTEVWGTKLNIIGDLDNSIDVITYRCQKCEYLESYAKE